MGTREERLLDRLERLQRRLEKQTRRGGGGGLGVLGGFLLGALAGGALALVAAPQSGEETREQLCGTSIELKDRATQVAGQAREQAESIRLPARDENGARSPADAATGEAAELAGEARERTRGAAEAIEIGRRTPPAPPATGARSTPRPSANTPPGARRDP